jgi:hypothetical protein
MISLKFLNPRHIISFIAKMRSHPIDLERAALHDAYRSIFLHNKAGQAVLENLAKLHFVGRMTLVRDDRKSAFNEGRRYVVESIIHTINNDLKTLEAITKAAEAENNTEES